MKRRSFFRVGGAVAALSALDFVTLQKAFGSNGMASQKDGELVAVMGADPGQMLVRAIEELGGIGKFIKSGDKVVIKPNIGWAKTPDLAANTNPDVVGALTKLCVDYGAKEVIVLDHTCNEWKTCYKMSGIQKAVETNGGKMAPANSEHYYEMVQLPKGKILKETKIHKELIGCDVWFNIPVLKHHGGAKMSISMKNMMGTNWDRKYFHKNGLQQCIADLNTWEKRPALHIVDAYRTLTQNGPQGKGPEDVMLTKSLFASADPVAVDTAATKFFGQMKPVKLEDVSHLKFAEEHLLGSMDLTKKTIKRIKI